VVVERDSYTMKPKKEGWYECRHVKMLKHISTPRKKTRMRC